MQRQAGGKFLAAAMAVSGYVGAKWKVKNDKDPKSKEKLRPENPDWQWRLSLHPELEVRRGQLAQLVSRVMRLPTDHH